jgi:hypothetical protein
MPMPDFLKINATEDDPIIRWINLNAVMFVIKTKTQDGDKLNIKFIDSTNMIIDGELTEELITALDFTSVNDCLPNRQDLIKHFDDIPTREEVEAMSEDDSDYSDDDDDDNDDIDFGSMEKWRV